MRCALSLMAVLLVTAAAAMAQDDNESSRRSLRGLTGAQARVDNLSPAAEVDGLAKTAIQTDVELKLRLAGIKVLTSDQAIAAPGQPLLHIIVATAPPTSEGLHPCFVRVELQQTVMLGRDLNRGDSDAITWRSLGEVGAVGSRILPGVRDTIKDRMDRFVNAYLSMNPK